MDNLLSSVLGGLFVLVLGTPLMWMLKPTFEKLRSLRGDEEMSKLIRDMEYSPSIQLWWRSQADMLERWSIVAGVIGAVAFGGAIAFPLSSEAPLSGWFLAGAGAVLIVINLVATYLCNVVRKADKEATNTRFREEFQAAMLEQKRKGELEFVDATLTPGATLPDGQERDGEGSGDTAGDSGGGTASG